MTPPADLIDALKAQRLDELIAAAGGFNSREARDRLVNVRFTQAELELLDSLAGTQAITRIELIRKLLNAGVEKHGAAHRLAAAAAGLVHAIRSYGLVTQVGRHNVTPVDEALEDFGTVNRPAGVRREVRGART